MGRNSKRTLLGTIVLVVLFELTAYSADITFRFHIAPLKVLSKNAFIKTVQYKIRFKICFLQFIISIFIMKFNFNFIDRFIRRIAL